MQRRWRTTMPLAPDRDVIGVLYGNGTMEDLARKPSIALQSGRSL